MSKEMKPIFKTPSEFEKKLKDQVELYFANQKITKTGNILFYLKSFIIFIGLISTYSFLVFYHTHYIIFPIFLLFLLVQFKVLLAFNVMHDGGHSSFSKNSFLNNLASKSMDLLGSSSFLWKIKHNSLHHTYTNITGKDDDIDGVGFLIRLSPYQKKLPWHKYQHIYAPFLYSFLSLYMLFWGDFQKMISKKIGTFSIQYTKKDMAYFILTKILYFTYTLIIPMLFFSPIIVFLFFFLGHLLFGLTLSLVFQLAHTVSETQFPNIKENTQLNDSWIEHQLKTTMNFSPKSKLLTFYLGGLNYQVEHHLFHRINHIHYPKISRIVQKICVDYQKPYLIHSNFWKALKSHFTFLKKMGNSY